MKNSQIKAGIAVFLLFISVLSFTQKSKSSPQRDDQRLIVNIQNNNSFNTLYPNGNGEYFSAGYVNSEIKSIGLNSVTLNTGNQFSVQNNTYQGKLSDDIFSNKVTFKLNEKVSSSFHCPQRLHVKYDQEMYPGTLEPGMRFTWVPDPTSDGVIARIIFFEAESHGMSRHYQKQLTIKDKGIFAVPKKWLDEFPANCYVMFSISRTKKHTVKTGGNQKIDINFQSSSSSTLRIP